MGDMGELPSACACTAKGQLQQQWQSPPRVASEYSRTSRALRIRAERTEQAS